MIKKRFQTMSKTQNYISSELTHFVGRSLENNEERYQLFLEIIRSGKIRTRNDNGRGCIMSAGNWYGDISSNEAFNPDMVCFCDIPESDFEIHMKKYSHFGISFKKDFLISQGMRPVYYIPSETVVAKKDISNIFNENLKDFGQFLREHKMSLKMEHFFNFHIFSFVKFFDSNKDDGDPDNYYMEREWRSLERIEFEVNDVTRIILPSSYIKRFFQDIPDYNSHITTT